MPLLADRDLTAKGVEVDLLGHRARMAEGPAALAITTGAPLLAAVDPLRAAAGAAPGCGGRRGASSSQFNEPSRCRAECTTRDQVRAT